MVSLASHACAQAAHIANGCNVEGKNQSHMMGSGPQYNLPPNRRELLHGAMHTEGWCKEWSRNRWRMIWERPSDIPVHSIPDHALPHDFDTEDWCNKRDKTPLGNGMEQNWSNLNDAQDIEDWRPRTGEPGGCWKR